MTRRRELQTQLTAYRERLGKSKFKEVAQSRLVHYSTESDPVILELIVISTNTYVGMGYHYLGLNSSGLNSSTQCLEQALALVEHYLAQQAVQALTDEMVAATHEAWEGGIQYCMLPGIPHHTYYSYGHCEYASCDLADAPRSMDDAIFDAMCNKAPFCNISEAPYLSDEAVNADMDAWWFNRRKFCPVRHVWRYFYPCTEYPSCDLADAPRTMEKASCPLGLDCPGNGDCWDCTTHKAVRTMSTPKSLLSDASYPHGSITNSIRYLESKCLSTDKYSAQRLQADKAHDYARRHGWDIALPSRTTD